MNVYQASALEGASGVELTIALYDGIIRFLHAAIEAVEQGDIGGRRAAVKRAMDIVIYLQARLKTDIGFELAKALGDFYVAQFALMLQGSQGSSREKLLQVIANVRNVREVWRQVALDPGARRTDEGAAPIEVEPQGGTQRSGISCTA